MSDSINETSKNHSVEQYKLLVESITDYAIYMLDASGHIKTWNKGAERIKGYSSSEVLGKHVSIFYLKEEKEKEIPEQELKIALETGRFEGQGWRKRKDDSLFWAHLIITPVFDEKGKQTGFSKITRDLTESKKAELALQESQEKLRLFIEGIDNIIDYGIFLLDENGYINTWNKGAERMKGYKEEEILGKHFSIFYPKDSVEAGYPEYELQKAAVDRRFEDEGWRIRKDGSKFWANIILTPIYSSNQEVVGYTKVARDLTERKVAQSHLKETEDKYRLLIESVEDYAIFMLDREGFVTSWNKGAERIKGYKAEEILGKHFSRFYPKKALDDNFPAYELQKAKEKGRFEDQGWRVRNDGSIFWANVVITAIRNRNGEVVGFSKITRDLTEQKKAERALKESEERLRLLLESIKDYAIFMLDPFGNIASWNQGATRIKGYKAEEVMGKHFSIFYQQDARAAGYPDYELRMAKEKGRFEDEGWRLRKDGSKFWASVIISPIRNFDNKLIGFSKVTRDLTERKRHIEELERKNIELKQLTSDLDSFIYSASHDLRSPISNIEGLLNLLSKALPDAVKEENITKILAMMEKSIDRFRETVYDMSEVSKVQKSFHEKAEEVDVEEIMEDTIETLQQLFPDQEIPIKVDYDDSRKINFIKSNLRRVLYNLLSNAVKYRSLERPLEISVKFEQTSDHTVLEVSDNGLGIDPKHKEGIFTMFKRYYSHVEGTGVGLYIVKRIVDSSAGRIEVESQIGIGSTFRIYFSKY